ncbi:MAG: hypothetical protein ACR2NP_18210 [Pirellulaceae bacterium]
MNSLAFWRQNDRLGSEYIEPPAHQFSPSQTEMASTSNDAAGDDDSLPPLPPNVDRTMESFEQEVTDTYRQLAQQNQATGDRKATPIQPVDVDTSHVSSPPANFGSSDFSSPLTPRTVENDTAAVSTPATPANSNDFMPDSASLAGISGNTQYERLAQQMLEPAKPPAPTNQPPAAMPVVRSPEMPNPLTPAHGGGEFAATASQPAPGAQRVQNPYASNAATAQPLQPRTETPIGTQAAQPPAEPAAVQINFDQYPTTPYRSFESGTQTTAPADRMAAIPSPEPATMPGAPATSSSMGTGSPLSLQIQGQGTYAPGSVRTPAALNPAELQLPQSVPGGSSTSSGGSFQPR